MTTNLDTISIAQLDTVTGGAPKGQQPDFASNYVNRLRQDTNAMYNRRVATGNALKNHNWGAAAKNAGAYVLNGIHGAFDLVNFT